MLKPFRLTLLSATFGMAFLAINAVPQLKASEFDNKTFVTFDAPVELSGRVLIPGTYVFKTLQDDKNVVVVANRDEDHLVALVATIPIEAVGIPEKTQIELTEGASNSPEIVHAWFYPGDAIGWEFPVPKSERK